MLSLLTSIPITVKAQVINAQTNASHLNLMPVPASVQLVDGRIGIDSKFKIGTKGHKDARLQAALERFSKRLQGRVGLAFEPALSSDIDSATLVIETGSAGQSIPSLAEDESYKIETSEKQVQLTAPTVIGVIRGVETLLQLLSADRDGYYFPGVRIQDQPRFKWRGLCY